MSGSAHEAASLSVSLPLLLHQLSPGAPEQALQDSLRLLDVDAFDGVGLQQQLGQPLEAG